MAFLMKRKKDLFMIILACALVCAALFIFAGIINRKELKKDVERVFSSTEKGLFLTMFSGEEIYSEDFETYCGIKTIFGKYRIKKMSQLQLYLNELSVQGGKDCVYIKPDPYALFRECGNDVEKYKSMLAQKLESSVQSDPSVQFVFLLPNPSIDFWMKKKEKDRDMILESYSVFAESMLEYSNVQVYFAGNERWLIDNPSNYKKDGITVNRDICFKLTFVAICNYRFLLSGENCANVFQELKAILTEESEKRTEYPDLSDHVVVFFGDSIVANYRGSDSVTGVVTGLSGAETVNYAMGGTTAGFVKEGDNSFIERVSEFLKEEKLPQDKKKAFIIEYGLNDFFRGIKVNQDSETAEKDSYFGGLNSGICFLREKYPEADFYILSPSFCANFEFGTEVQSKTGGVLTDYVRAAEQCADYLKTGYIDNYHGLGINKDNVFELTVDGCHLNEEGRFRMAKSIINEIYVTNSR